MADIELVIKISNYDKEWITNGYYIPEEIKANGTPLPKGHGALIDVDKIIGKIYGVGSIVAVLDAPTIIEADTESEDKRGFEMKYIKNGELQDKKIVDSIYIAAKEYENGEILEVKDRLLEIIAAIDEWSEDN